MTINGFDSDMSGKLIEEIFNTDLAEAETKPKLKLPRKYKVVLINDDYTPMEFVVEVLKYFFHMSEEAATSIMLQVHTKGKGICGVFSRDVAETKVNQVNDFARTNQHPLLCSMEPE